MLSNRDTETLWGNLSGEDGALEPLTLEILFAEMAPAAAPADFRFLRQFLAAPKAEVAYLAFVDAVIRARDCVRAALKDAHPCKRAMQLLAGAIKGNAGAREVFIGHDRDDDGFLGLDELPGFLTAVLPLGPGDDAVATVGLVMASLYCRNADEDGALTYTELKDLLPADEPADASPRLPSPAARSPRSPVGALSPAPVSRTTVPRQPTTRPSKALQSPRETALAVRAAVPASPPAPKPWKLKERRVKDRKYLVDAPTGRVYEGRSAGSLVRAGTMVDGEVVLLREEDTYASIFDKLDAYICAHQGRLEDMIFGESATDGGGFVTTDALQRFMPQLSAKQASYIYQLMDINGDGLVTLEEMLKSVKQCRAMGSSPSFATDDGRNLRDVLAKVAAKVAADEVNLWDMVSACSSAGGAEGLTLHKFCELDADSSGEIERREMLKLLETCFPDLTGKEKRQMLMHIKQLDLDGNGKLSYPELLKGLQLVPVEIEAEIEEVESEEESLGSADSDEVDSLASSALAAAPVPVSPPGRQKAFSTSEMELLAKETIDGSKRLLQEIVPVEEGHRARSPRAGRRARPGSAAPTLYKSVGPAPKVEWKFKRIYISGHGSVLVEQESSRVFVRDTSGFLVIKGVHEDGKVQSEKLGTGFFDMLQRYLEAHKERLQFLFSKYDREHGGGAGFGIPSFELRHLLEELMPSISASQAR